MPSPSLFAIFGPTGVGKTNVAIALAELLRKDGRDPVAVSADALQVYQGMATLTGTATAQQQRLLEHRLVNFVPVTDTFSVAAYARAAHSEIDDLLARGQTPIVVGGTGLYLRAALAELALRPPPQPGVRQRWESQVAQHGPATVHAHLASVAPATAAKIDPNDRHRIIRALELHEAGALASPDSPSQLWTSEMRHATVLVGLTMDREVLYRQIEDRVDEMVKAGVVEEVVAADRAGASITARKALGFAQCLEGDIEGMKTRTRQYARRQITWMSKLKGIEIIDVSDRSAGEVAAQIVDIPVVPATAFGSQETQ